MKDYSIKSIREDFKSKGVFYTPKELALTLKSYIDTPYKNVYDPTCGRGNLLSVFEEGIEKYGQDINENEVQIARETIPNFKGMVGDTLKEPAFMDMKFDCIVANPPFSVKWEQKTDIRFENAPCLPPASKADYAFLLHIMHLLSDSGTAAVLNFPGIAYRKASEGKIRQYMVEQNWIDKVVHIPGDKFTDTKIATLILVLKKNKATTDIEFIDTELDKNNIVSISQVAENDYSLSINNYIEKEIVKEHIDPLQLERDIRANILSSVRQELELSKLIYELEGSEAFGMKDFITELEKVIKEYKEKVWQQQEVF